MQKISSFPRRYLLAACVMLMAGLFLAGLQPLEASSTAQATDPTTDGEIIVPIKPAATATLELKPNLQILRYYTSPERPQAKKQFALFLEIKNVGGASADGWYVRPAACQGGSGATFTEAINPCMQNLSNLPPNSSTTINFNMAYDELGTQNLNMYIEPQHDIAKSIQTNLHQISFYVYDSDPDPTLTFAYPQPDIFIRNWWTAKAGATGDDMQISIPVTDTQPFELVLDLQNLGQTDAYNVRLDFCERVKDLIQPAGDGCHQYIPTGLRPRDHATASHTMAFNNEKTDVPAYTIAITYEFQYNGKFYTESTKKTIYIDRQALAAQALAATATAQSKIGNTSEGTSSNNSTDFLNTGSYLIVDTPALNIRSGPGTDYPAIGATNQGRHFALRGRNGDGSWWQIDVDGHEGWVYAGLVQAVGGQGMPVIQIPPAPQSTPAPQLAANSTPENGEAYQIAYTTGENASPQPATSPVSSPIPTPPAPASLAQSTGSDVIIDSYETQPKQIVPGQPFRLQVTLRNIGAETVNRTVVRIGSDQAIPVGSGEATILPPLPAGESGLFERQLLLAQPSGEAVTPLSVEIDYVDGQGQAHSHQEQIGLVTTALMGTAMNTPTETTPRPLWLRLVSGLLGLGAGAR